MRLALGVFLSALVLAGAACSVPDVSFVAPDAAADAPPAADARADAAGSGGSDAGGADGAKSPYCTTGNPPQPAPDGGRCCSNGAACYGDCSVLGCDACGRCAWPSVCCTRMNVGACQAPPCP